MFITTCYSNVVQCLHSVSMIDLGSQIINFLTKLCDVCLVALEALYVSPLLQ